MLCYWQNALKKRFLLAKEISPILYWKEKPAYFQTSRRKSKKTKMTNDFFAKPLKTHNFYYISTTFLHKIIYLLKTFVCKQTDILLNQYLITHINIQ